jgi:hypothetical protein
MSKTLINEVPGLVSTWWNDDLHAIHIKWYTEYAEGSEVIEAVNHALRYVEENKVEHWFVDLSTSKCGLKAEDQLWVETEFKKAIANSPLKKIAMMPPLPETGQDTGWLDDWEANTKTEYRGQIDARLLSNEGEIKRFFDEDYMMKKVV